MPTETQNILNAFRTGQMDPASKQEFVEWVGAGKVPGITPGMLAGQAQQQRPETLIDVNVPQIQGEKPQGQIEAPPELVEAYESDQMDDQAKQEFEEYVKAGRITLPPGAELKGGGLLSTIIEPFTGAERTTPEIEAMPDWYDLPELSGLDIKSFNAMVGTAIAGPDEVAKVLTANFPKLGVRPDAKGNLIFRSAEDGQDYGYKPGLRTSDIERAISAAALYIPAGLAKTLMGRVGASMATQTAIEGAQKAVGGEFDIEEIPLAAVPDIAGAAGGAAFRWVKGRKVPISAEEQAVRGAQRAGIEPLTSDIIQPQTWYGKLTQAVSERFPAGVGRSRAVQQESRVKAIRDIMIEHDAIDAIDATPAVIKDFVDKHQGRMSHFTAMKDGVIDKLADKGIMPVDNAIKAFDKEIAFLQKEGLPVAANALAERRAAFLNKNSKSVDLQRGLLGDMLDLDDHKAHKRVLKNSVHKIYRGVKEDMRNFIKKEGSSVDLSKWAMANHSLKGIINDKAIPKALKKALDSGDVRPNQIRSMLFSRDKAEINTLYKRLSPGGKANARVAIIQEVIDKSGGIENLTAAGFEQKMKQFRKSWGTFFVGREGEKLKGLIKAVKLTRRAQEAGVKPSTGAELTFYATISLLSDLFGVSAAGGFGLAVGIGQVGRVYESKAVRDALLRVSRVQPGKEQAALRALENAVKVSMQFREEKTT